MRKPASFIALLAVAGALRIVHSAFSHFGPDTRQRILASNDYGKLPQLLLALSSLPSKQDGRHRHAQGAYALALSKNRHRPHHFSRRSKPLSSSELDDGLEVQWLPLDTTLPSVEPHEGATTMPVFPLSGMDIIPGAKPGLTIFEPRYREMYNDILYSGARRFVVCSVNENGDLSNVGAVYYLDDLTDLSGMSDDALKYAAKHTVIGSVKLLKILNPSVWKSRESYLRAEIEEISDSNLDEDTIVAEAEVKKSMEEFVSLQARLDENPRFSNTKFEYNYSASVDDGGLWATIDMWQKLLDARSQVVNGKCLENVQRTVFKAITEGKVDQSIVKGGSIRIEELPEDLKKEVQGLVRTRDESLREPMNRANGPDLLSILLCTSHSQRLLKFKRIIDRELQRLRACESLKSLFSS